jgi:RNA polymerase sigma factor (sigma-70 family)
LSLTATVTYDELVERCKQGDSRGYKELYDRYAKAMFNTSLRIVNSIPDAEDVLQESFVSAFGHIADFDYSATFGAWLKRIVINKSISLIRKKKLVTIDIDETSVIEIEEEVDDMEESIELKVENIKLGIMQLSPGYRTVLSLVLFESYSYTEVSALLNITETTVRTQYYRARQKLLEILKTEQYHERQTAKIH